MKGTRTVKRVMLTIALIMAFSPKSSFAAATNSDRLLAGQSLCCNQSLVSADGRFALTMQADGNLVLYYPGHIAMWASNTAGHSGTDLEMQADGNLVIYETGHHAIWASNTAGHSGAYLITQKDGNAVIYAGGVALWATNTVAPTASSIDSYLRSKGSPMAGQGAAFMQYGGQYDVDPRFIVAVAGTESSFGRSTCAPYNAWGIKPGGRCTSFSSWAAGIQSFADLIANSSYYFRAGRYSVSAIGAVYCGSGCTSWVPNTTTFLTQQDGYPNDVRWKG